MPLYIYLFRAAQVVVPFGVRGPRFLRRSIWKMFYSSTGRVFLPHGVARFLNLGYVPDPGVPGTGDSEEGSADLADRLSAQLYDAIADGSDLAGRTVVEVGCGSGAGCAHMARAYGPESLLGIDLNDDLIAWCRENHDLPNVEFQQGDAQDLPIESGTVDAVMNVESSHCYPSRLRFFEEVARVLRPGGSFMLGDIVFVSARQNEADAVSDQLRRAGFLIEDRVDITSNVLAARDAVSGSSFRSRMRSSMPAAVVPLAEEGFCLPGSRFYAAMADERVQYIRWTASKPVEDSLAKPGKV